MRILGIDCGTERTGYGVIDSDGRTHSLINTGVVRLRASASLSERLRTLAIELRQLLSAHAPEVVAVEEVFHAVNTQSALKLAHVRGVVLLLAAEAAVPVAEYSPLSIKMSVTGYGRAEKAQVKTMVESVLRCGEVQVSSFDASDALAVAICHATRGMNQAKIQTVVARRLREKPSLRPRQSNGSIPTA